MTSVPSEWSEKRKKRHFTATCYVVQDKKALFIYHKKFKKWLPPGGHLEVDETPSEAVKREVLEETGLEIELIPQENLKIEFQHARSIIRPYLCLLERIPAYGEEPEHEHVDLIFLGYPVGGALFLEAKWFSLKEIETLEEGLKVFPDTKLIMKHLYETFLFDTHTLKTSNYFNDYS